MWPFLILVDSDNAPTATFQKKTWATREGQPKHCILIFQLLLMPSAEDDGEQSGDVAHVESAVAVEVGC